MDPITQGALGASLSQSLSHKKNVLIIGLIGFLSGMAPDLDVLIRSDTDPLLFLEYHRQFTHSLLFIPVGGLICALTFYLLITRYTSLTFRSTYLYCTLGYATHGLLDTCTSYGTQLLWPISDQRFAWNTVSVIDPLLSIPLLLLIVLATIRKQPAFALAGFIWVITYQIIGAYQNHRASEAGYHLATERGHQPLRLEAKPSFANLILWKVIYETEDDFYTDGVRLGLNTKIYPGKPIARLNIDRDFPWLISHSQQAIDLQRFNKFSQGYTAVDPNNPQRVIDVRYSLLPNQATGLWSLWLDAEAHQAQHAQFKMDRQINQHTREKFLDMLFNQ